MQDTELRVLLFKNIFFYVELLYVMEAVKTLLLF